MKLDLRGYQQFFGYEGDVIKFRRGSWSGEALVGYPIHELAQQHIYEFVCNEKEEYHEYKIIDRSIIQFGPGNVSFGQTKRA